MAHDDALQPLAPGDLIRLANGSLQVDVAPAAGGRIARISYRDQAWLAGHGGANAAMIAWGCYPMLPWAGRIRHGRFAFAGESYQLPANLGGHAIHGVGFALPWQVDGVSTHRVELSLRLPEDERWPFGGVAKQNIELTPDTLHCTLRLQAGERAMPRPVVGWHPWFLKPDQMEFEPEGMYPRDAEGVAIKPVAAPASGPWDDCFINYRPVVLRRKGQCVRLISECSHWVVYDVPEHATCVEPQSGPPDAFNLDAATLPPRGWNGNDVKALTPSRRLRVVAAWIPKPN